MKPERIDAVLASLRPSGGFSFTDLSHAELLHLLRCARVVAELDRAWNYRIQKMRDGVLISYQDLPVNSREESEGTDLLTATEAALARAKETT